MERPIIPINYFIHNLRDMDKVHFVADTLERERGRFERYVLQGFGELVDKFNSLTLDDSALQLMPRTMDLLSVLDGLLLPGLQSLTSEDFIHGTREAARLMLMGQKIKKNQLEPSRENKDIAIGTPSMDTHDMALAVGTAGHIIERSMFHHFHDRGITQGERGWKKDDILFALEECALLMAVQFTRSERASCPILLQLITSPNDFDASKGGLGWRKQHELVSFFEAYQQIQLARMIE